MLLSLHQNSRCNPPSAGRQLEMVSDHLHGFPMPEDRGGFFYSSISKFVMILFIKLENKVLMQIIFVIFVNLQ